MTITTGIARVERLTQAMPVKMPVSGKAGTRPIIHVRGWKRVLPPFAIIFFSVPSVARVLVFSLRLCVFARDDFS